MTLDRQLAPYLDAIEDKLRRSLCSPDKALNPLYQMMQYHLGWLDEMQTPVKASRGKRLRPLLCLLACQSAGTDWEKALPAATCLELIHNFSLIHDDIEDNSATRRHRPTLWKLWGLAQGINTGDAMWVIARRELQQFTNSTVSLGCILEVYSRVDDACIQLCHGQYLDISFETAPNVTLAAYEEMIKGKTASLFAASTAIGAIVAGAELETVAHYYSFGLELGIAFQIQDDILGIWGDPAITGKSAADDILSKKKTFPVLSAFAWEEERGLHDLSEIYKLPVFTSDALKQVLILLARAHAQTVAQQRVRTSLEAVTEHLALATCSQPAGNTLKELALSLVQRAN